MSDPKIKHGYFNAFYAFKLFESDESITQYKSVLKKLQESGILISSETINREVSFMNTFSELLKERKKEYRKFRNENKPLPQYLSSSITKTHDKPIVTITPTNTHIEYNIQDDLSDELDVSQQDSLSQLVAMYSAEEQYTGLSTKNFKNKFVLFPPRLTINSKNIHPSIFLTVFKHGYAIIHFAMEIESMTYNEINNTGWDIQLDNVHVPELLVSNNHSYKMTKVSRISSINSLLIEYGKWLDKEINFENKDEIGQFFFHLVLSDFAYRPNDFSKDSTYKFNETFFKLLYAPIQDHQLMTEQQTEDFIEHRYYSFSKYLRVYANNNRTISTYTKDFKAAVKLNFEDSDHLDDPFILNSLAQKSSLGGMVTAIESMLLKKEATQRFSVFEVQEHTSLKQLIDLLIKENLNYSFEFTKYFYTYGSVRELISFLEDKCEDYLQIKLMNERRERIEKVIRLKKERDVANFTALGPVFTIILTSIFSFPALENILDNFNKDEYLSTTYIMVNLLFSIVVIYLFRAPLREARNDLYNNIWPHLNNRYWKFSMNYYFVSYSLLEFLNLEYKEAFRQIYIMIGTKIKRN